MPQPRALVLGGTGHIGAAITHDLVQSGYAVTATGHHPRERPNLDGLPVTIAIGDDMQPGIAEEWIAEADLVVDAATPYPLWMHTDRGEDPVKHAVFRSRRIVAAARDQNAALIHISSFTTLPRRQGVVSGLRQGVVQGLHRYFDLKKRVEREVEAGLRAGLRGCVVLPAAVFGPFDLKRRDQAFVPMLLSGKVAGLVRREMNIIDVRDLAQVVTACAATEYRFAKVPAFGHNICLAELARQICRIGNVPPPRLHVPSFMGAAGLYWMETAFALAGQKTPWPSLPMLLVEASYPAQPSPEQHALHPKLRPLPDTLRDAISWYRQIGYI